MTGDEAERGSGTRLVAGVRDGLRMRTLVIGLAGVLAGASLGVLGEGAVVVPLVGAVPGVLVGTIGVLVAFGVYRRVGCCADCGGSTLGGDCGCAGDCGDSCSYDH